jgi:copper chaperone
MSQARTYTFTITGMHCASCALRIDDALEDLPGVNRSQSSVRAGRTVVDTDPAGVDLDVLVAVIASLGYQGTVQQS